MNLSDFFVIESLYMSLTLPNDDLIHLGDYTDPIDCFCKDCKNDSLFQRSPLNRANTSRLFYNFVYGHDSEFTSTFEFYCSRNNNHKIYTIIYIKKNTDFSYQIVKIGQYPSIRDINQNNISKYKNLLKEKSNELTTAIGLFAHGIGIGSFVYLRRIFETLVENAHKEASLSANWDEVKYLQERMSGKIQLLKDYLPDFLVDHSPIYSIISKGIHELSEEECKEFFPVILDSITHILDEQIEKLEKIKRTPELSKSIESIAVKLKD